MGDYHPHGDVALYEALVRLSQDWVMRVPLVHGEGNFGSVDGDPPAAYRYTEAKLTRVAERLLTRTRPGNGRAAATTTPATEREPVVLPAQFPNLLVNGTSGIAVGMATNIPPHNLGEVLRACVHLIENPDATVAQLARPRQGAGLPARRQDRHRPRDAAQDLRGGHRQHQGAGRVEGRRPSAKGKQQIVVTSIPYGVDKGELEDAIGAIIEEREAAATARAQSNESNDKDGLRIVLEVKPGTDPQPGDGLPLQAHRAAEDLLVQHDRARAGDRTARRWCRRTA